MLEVINTETSDLEQVFEFFDHSINYQEKKGYPVWRNYDRNAVIQDNKIKNQYKMVIDSKTAIVFSVCYTHKLIWRDLDEETSVYLHRTVVNPEFKGQKLFGSILEWLIEHAKKKGLHSIRLDTWATNPNIINYYKSFGFTFVENYTTPDNEELPSHNRNLALTLLEYKL